MIVLNYFIKMNDKDTRSLSTSFNITKPNKSELDMQILTKSYKNRIMRELKCQQKDYRNLTRASFGIPGTHILKKTWKQENYEKYIANTPNKYLVQRSYLSQMGYVNCMIYTPDGEFIIAGYSSGMIQVIV